MDADARRDLGPPLPPDALADPLHREVQAFPKLTDAQLDAVRAFAEPIELPRGHCLYRRGDRDLDFFAVLSGAIEIFATDSYGRKRYFATHGPGNFTGELYLFNHTRALVDGCLSEPSRLLRVRRNDFRRMLAAEPELAEVLLRAFVLRRTAFLLHDFAGVTLMGDPHDPDTLRLRRFLAGNAYPHRFLTPEARTDDDRSVLGCLRLTGADLPAVWDSRERVLRNPSISELAAELGLADELGDRGAAPYDVLIVGAGPAGLAAAVYAASEGLETALIEAVAPGGQAGTSSRIENYLGFPNGISGRDLAARAEVQAQKFGVHVSIARAVTCLHRDSDGVFTATLEGGTPVSARSVIVASGACYRKLDLPEYARFEGHGIHYAATAMEAQLCGGEPIVIVGGGNSAGQAAIFLSRHAARVHLVVRGGGLSSSMSRYLIERIEASPRIRVHYGAEVRALEGNRVLERVTWRERAGGASHTEPARNLFVMIGAVPNTAWLSECVALDEKGFVLTGRPRGAGPPAHPYETSRPGVFAVGDVRAGSVKRVASAVGEGSIVVQEVHAFLSSRARLAEAGLRRSA